MKQAVREISEAVERYKQLILDAERYIWAHPETGYREVQTSSYLAKQFEALGYQLIYADGITGFFTTVDTGRKGPEVLILGELDSIICPTHKDADPKTGAVHACGHNVQCATLLGIAAALTDTRLLSGLSGRIRLCAVPAEELLEIEYRRELKKQGRIRYFGGKSEFLSRGYFDGVDLALMVHASKSFSVLGGSVGCIAKNIIYKGKAAHAGGAPWSGVNALYAATCGIQAANALRETFREADMIRFHPIITHGGDMVNAIPERVQIESYVRGASYEAIVAANRRINRAICGAALSIGANVEIVDLPGYAPMINDPNLIEVVRDAAELALPDEEFHVSEQWSTGSTDMGDLSCIMPAVHPYAAGTRGTSHGQDYEVFDPVSACVSNAKWQLTMLRLLLGDGAKRAKEIVAAFKPRFASKEEFLAYQDSLQDEGDRILYRENGDAEVRLH